MSGRSREALEQALRAAGFSCRIEAWDALAVAIPAPGDRRFEDPELRQRAVTIAREHGFSHLALELVEEGDGGSADRAALPRH
jgi:hypothetical protein